MLNELLRGMESWKFELGHIFMRLLEEPLAQVTLHKESNETQVGLSSWLYRLPVHDMTQTVGKLRFAPWKQADTGIEAISVGNCLGLRSALSPLALCALHHPHLINTTEHLLKERMVLTLSFCKPNSNSFSLIAWLIDSRNIPKLGIRSWVKTSSFSPETPS